MSAPGAPRAPHARALAPALPALTPPTPASSFAPARPLVFPRLLAAECEELVRRHRLDRHGRVVPQRRRQRLRQPTSEARITRTRTCGMAQAEASQL
eukprot:5191953-Pleurochrysis_carterae.AAC.5